ncbi:MAG: IS21 family transposase [Burkholderiaceae bacterium]
MRRGESDREIARSKYLGRRKIGELRQVAEQQGWLQPEAAMPDDATIAGALSPPRRAASTVSTLEAHRPRIEEWVQQGVNGVAIHAALKRAHGYTGSYSSVYRMINAIGASAPADVTVPLTFAPGAAAQVDFGAGPELFDAALGKVRRTWCFVMTLCFSRHQYVEFVWDQTVPTWLGCHRRAFEWFAAVPARLIIDNPKCAITRACRTDPLVQRAYAECAEGYGFKIDPCPPADPQKKGIVEAGVKYVKGNFVPLRSFRDLADLNAQAQRWVLEEAGRRVHGTTRRLPLELFDVERPLMMALPVIAPALGSWHRVIVHRDCHVAHARMLYSVPFALVGLTLWLRAGENAVSIYQDYRLVAAHRRGRRPGERLTVTDHLPPEARAFLSRDHSWCLQQARLVGTACSELVERLLADRILERLRAAQGILRLRERYGVERVEAACARALYHASPFYRTVKSILAGGYDQQPLCEPVTDQVHAPTARFARNAQSLFDSDVTPSH